MPRVVLTPNLRAHVSLESVAVDGATVAEALAEVFRQAPTLRGYVLDDQGEVRHHVAVFVDGRQLRDRRRLTDTVDATSEIYLMQALSGG